MSFKHVLGVILAGALTAGVYQPSSAQQVEGPDLNQNITTKSGKVLILRKGRMSNVMSGTSGDQRPIFVVNYKTAYGPDEKAKMAQEAASIVPTLKADLAEGYSGLMICPYADTDKGATPYDMFMFEEDAKHVWKSTTPVKSSKPAAKKAATKSAKAPAKPAAPKTSTANSVPDKPAANKPAAKQAAAKKTAAKKNAAKHAAKKSTAKAAAKKQAIKAAPAASPAN